MEGLVDYPLTLTHFFEPRWRLFAKKRSAPRIPGARFSCTHGEFTARATSGSDTAGLRG